MVLIILLLSGCVIQDDVPQIGITLIDHPQELIVTDTHEFTISLTNEGGASALDVTLESNIPALLTFDPGEIEKINTNSSIDISATLEAVDILKETREFDSIETIIKVKYFDAQGDQKITKTSFKFTLRKPEVHIDKVEAGLLPGKITARENEKIPISIYVKNEEDRRMENLFIIFCSEYEYVTVYRLDMEESGNCYHYAITDVLWYNDLLAKGFTMEAELPPGAREVSFILQVKLTWESGDYTVVLDMVELNVQVSPT
jgi:uncharacterized repeat protein (TIGR01451 family)